MSREGDLLEEITAHLERERTWIESFDHLRIVHRVRGMDVPAEVSECDKLHAELHLHTGEGGG